MSDTNPGAVPEFDDPMIVTDDADRETGARERFALDNFGRQAELAAQRANFVLEEQPKRLDEFQLHSLR